MRVLITGGGGFLGAAVVRALIARGDLAIAFDTQLAALAAHPDSVGALLPPGVVLKPLAYDPLPTISIVLAWKAGNASPLVRAFVDLVRQSLPHRKDVLRLTGGRRKS